MATNTTARLARVISVRGKDREALLADPVFAYVGRANPRSGWKATPFRNEFKVGRGYRVEGPGEPRIVHVTDARQAVRLFYRCLNDVLEGRSCRVQERGIGAVFDRMTPLLPTLRGKTLGCWCGEWEPGQDPIACHGWVLAMLANGVAIEGMEEG